MAALNSPFWKTVYHSFQTFPLRFRLSSLSWAGDGPASLKALSAHEAMGP